MTAVHNGFAVRAKHLEKRYGDKTAIYLEKLEIQPGECFGFLGPNGAGKSSLMRMIYGRTPITEGELEILGMDARSEIRKIKARIGVVPQQDNLDPDFTVLDNLLVYASYFDIPRTEARDRAKQLLEFVQLQEQSKSLVEHLSGGMKRRLVIARALINEPDLVVLDEPTTGLDPQARHIVWSRLRELKKQGVTLLLTTHYMEEAAQLCDRLMVVHRGRMLSQGTVDDLIQKHVGGGVVELWFLDPDSREKVVALVGQEREGEGVRKWEASGEGLFLFCDSFQTAKRLCGQLRQWLPEEVMSRERPANLEDVFLSLAGRELDTEGRA